MTIFLDWALYYASIGWHVFPIAPGQKVPITKHGVKDATVDPERIKAWWHQWPNANIAVACGTISGIYVVDVDVPADGTTSGLISLEEFPPLPETVRQDTPRGGFHAFFVTTTPPKNKNAFRPGIDIRGDGYYVVLAPSIHPNGGRYVWTPGHAPGEVPFAEYPDYMRPATRAPGAAQQAYVPPPLCQPADSDVLRRASLYLPECEAAVQGQAGHDKLFWAAGTMVHGFGLSDGQAYDILAREYNPRCVPPWDLSVPADAKDFRRKITEARKNPPRDKPPLWLLNDPGYATVDTSSFDKGLQEMLANQAADEPEPEPGPEPEELPFLCQPSGLLGEICSWINATSIRQQPFLTLACALTFLGALFGRKIKDQSDTRTNLYCVGIAPSSAGKTRIMNQIRRLCEAAGCLELLGGDDIASDSAIEERMAREPATLFLWDEIGLLLSHIKSGVSKHNAKVVSLLMKLYSASGASYKGREYAEQERQRTIIQPCCCIFGTSTPERFTEGLTQEQLQDGWLSRCLVFSAMDVPPKQRGRWETDIPERLVEQVRAWYKREIPPADLPKFIMPPEGIVGAPSYPIPNQLIVPTADEADRMLIAFDAESEGYGAKYPRLACLWAKTEELARRIALINAAGDSFDTPIVTLANADFAIRLVRYLLLDFSRLIVPEIVICDVDARKRRLLKIIEQHGKNGCLKRTVTRASQWVNKRQRDDMLADMIEAGEIVLEIAGKQHNTHRYWTAEHFRTYLLEQSQCQNPNP